MSIVHVRTPSAGYDITIDAGLLPRVGREVRDVSPAPTALLVVDQQIVKTHGDTVAESLRSAGYKLTVCALVADEQHKNLDAVRTLYDAAVAGRLERSSPVVALGGGVTGDVAGFAAATFMRGVPVVQVPTTLLAMVDASIGGKTGVNYAPRDGDEAMLIKNLIGAFWQPRAVLIDPEVLETLHHRHYISGLAECIKHAVIADAKLFEWIMENRDAVAKKHADALVWLIQRCAEIKAEIVAEDVREAGRRALLNLGHTFGHAIEPITELELEHGEAVAIGLCAAARCAVELEEMGPDDAQLIADLLRSVDLPTHLPKPVNVDRLIQAMQRDKKVQGGKVRLILPTGIGSATIADDVPEDVVRSAWDFVGAGSG